MIIVKNRELLIPEPERYIGTTYDTESEIRQFLISRFAQNGVDLSALTFHLDLKYANDVTDTVVLDKEVTDTNIILTWNIGSSVLQVPGTLFIQLRAADDEVTVKWSSFHAALYVERHLNTPGTYTGSLTEIEQMEQDHQYMKGVVDELKNHLDYTHEAEGWAIGKKDGEDVPSTDETYHNNSKYYSEQAGVSATAAANSATAAAGSATQAAATVADTNTRFNNAVAAVTVNTEVQDARVGADGTTYTVLKNRLDAEHTDVKSETDYLRKASLIKSEILVGWKKIHYISVNKGIGAIVTVEHNEVSSANFDYIILPVEKGDQFALTGVGGSDARLFAWLDENNALLFKADASLEVMDYSLIAPSNGYLIVNVKRTEEYHLYKMKRTSNYIANHEYYYYPEDYGAVGDGVADDTDALQKCIDEAWLNKKPVLLRGKYATSRRLLVYGAIDNTKFGSIIRGVSVGDTAIIGTSDPIFLTYSGQYLIDGKAYDNTGSRIEISNLQIWGENKTNVGIRFRGSASNMRLDSLKISKCSNAIETTKQVFLSQFIRIRCDNCINGIYLPLIIHGFNTSLLIDSCYMQGCENGYTVAGSYMNIINSCADHITNNCLDITHFNGAINGFGCETPNAKTIIKAGNHTYATIINPYTYGNYNDADSCQIDIGSLSRVTIIGGTMGFDESTSHDKLAGHIVNISDETAHVEFVNTRFWQSDISNFVNMDGIESCDVIYNTMKYDGTGFRKVNYIRAISVRPSEPEIGEMIFDTSINKPIWYSGSDWRDASGQLV